jgi:hypothetical protein
MKKSILLALVVGMAGWLQAGAPAKLEVFDTGPQFEGLDEEIYPLGWAKDGERLAMLRARPNEAADERLWKVEVVDLVADKKVLDESILHPDEGGVAAFWAVHGTRVAELIKPHGVAAAEMEVRRFPALLGKFRGESYEVSLVRAFGEEPNFGYRGLTGLTVNLQNLAGKSKTVFETEWKEWFPLAAGVVGYVPNPDGSRIALLVGITKRGYEGAPHVRHVQVVGARVGEKF